MIVTRFAPSPTGQLHLGHAYSASLGHSRARNSGGKFLLRIEDLDPTRCRSEFVEGILEDLRWLGLEWDDAVLNQSARAAVYEQALGKLRDQGLIYPCFCTRSDIAAALEAPHSAAAHYPGTCRGRPDEPERRASKPYSWRLDSRKAVEIAGLPSWTEADGRRFYARADDVDDVILGRKDAPAAYHLACVIDDAASDVSLVTRASDLRASTPVQRLLQKLLGLPEPEYLHHPIVGFSDGRRLAKRDRAPTLSAMRELGVNGPELARELEYGKLPLGFDFFDA